MSENSSCAVILAGGQGKRMNSDLPKPMFEVLGVPMIDWVIDACKDSGIDDILVVTGFGHEVLEKHLEGRCTTVVQEERKGTGHAVMTAKDWLSERRDKDVAVLSGDAPFIGSGTLLAALWQHRDRKDDVTVITAEVPDPSGFGRVLRKGGGLAGIVEDKDATEEQRSIKEINSGAYWFSCEKLLGALGKLTPNNAQGEYYLTDTVYIILDEGGSAGAYKSSDPNSVLGANDRRELLKLNTVARFAVIDRLLDEGVEFDCTDGVIIGTKVRVGKGTKILKGTILSGDTVIGTDCVIGPDCLLDNTTVGDGTKLNTVQSHDAQVGKNVSIGPFVQLRPGTVVKDGVKIGDFVEIKNSVIGENTSVSHLTYVGDSDVGRGVNFGCGVATANYDGEKKFRTVIGDNAFIGCNTNLVAPVCIGNAAYTAAGSTITKDVPDGALAVERADTVLKNDFGFRRLKRRIEKNS